MRDSGKLNSGSPFRSVLNGRVIFLRHVHHTVMDFVGAVLQLPDLKINIDAGGIQDHPNEYWAAIF